MTPTVYIGIAGFVFSVLLFVFLFYKFGFNILFGRGGVVVQNKYGDYTYYKIKKIDEEYVHTKSGKYPKTNVRQVKFPFPLGYVRLYHIAFEDGKYTTDFYTIQDLLDGGMRELIRPPVDIFVIIILVLCVISIVLNIVLMTGQSDIQEGINSILKVFSSLGGGV